MLFLLLTPALVLAAPKGEPPAGFIDSPVWFSENPLVEGDEVTIYAVLYNGGTTVLTGTVSFFDHSALLGTRSVSIPAHGTQIVNLLWKVTAGDHIVSAVMQSPTSVVNGQPNIVTLSMPRADAKPQFVEKIGGTSSLASLASSSSLNSNLNSNLNSTLVALASGPSSSSSNTASSTSATASTTSSKTQNLINNGADALGNFYATSKSKLPAINSQSVLDKIDQAENFILKNIPANDSKIGKFFASIDSVRVRALDSLKKIIKRDKDTITLANQKSASTANYFEDDKPMQATSYDLNTPFLQLKVFFLNIVTMFLSSVIVFYLLIIFIIIKLLSFIIRRI